MKKINKGLVSKRNHAGLVCFLFCFVLLFCFSFLFFFFFFLSFFFFSLLFYSGPFSKCPSIVVSHVSSNLMLDTK